MTNNKNLENMNAEVQTAEEQEQATVVATIPEGDEDVKPDDEHPQPNDEDSGNDVQDNPGEETPDDETAENEEEAPKDKISNREKIILIVIAILLFALLAWGAATIINGWQREAIDDNSGSGLIITETTGDIDTTSSTEENNKNDGDASDTDDDNGNRDPGLTQQIQGNTSKRDDTEPTDKNQFNDTDNTANETDNTSKPNTGDSTTSKPDNTDKDDNQSSPTTDTVKDYIGDTTIRIANVNDDTAIINLTVDGKNISVPVQTTYFNGRITKTGVSQVKLFGYNSGVTVLLYYPETDGFAYNEVNGYMSRTDEGLTVLVDINGEGTKLLVKINGMKSLF